MRRRIYISPDSGLEDVTGSPYRYYRLVNNLPHGALYDDPIWNAYLAAREALSVLERAVIARLCGEPYDEVERRAADEACALLDDHETPSEIAIPKMDEVAARVLAHAEAIYGNGDAPR